MDVTQVFTDAHWLHRKNGLSQTRWWQGGQAGGPVPGQVLVEKLDGVTIPVGCATLHVGRPHLRHVLSHINTLLPTNIPAQTQTQAALHTHAQTSQHNHTVQSPALSMLRTTQHTKAPCPASASHTEL